MPKRTDIKKILIIGSGPIIIGQAAEFDYQLKRHASQVQRILDTISEVKAHISKSHHIAGE